MISVLSLPMVLLVLFLVLFRLDVVHPAADCTTAADCYVLLAACDETAVPPRECDCRGRYGKKKEGTDRYGVGKCRRKKSGHDDWHHCLPGKDVGDWSCDGTCHVELNAKGKRKRWGICALCQAPPELASNAPSTSAAPSMSPSCADTPGWEDACDLYEEHDDPGCPEYGDVPTEDSGVANDHCCYCKGFLCGKNDDCVGCAFDGDGNDVAVGDCYWNGDKDQCRLKDNSTHCQLREPAKFCSTSRPCASGTFCNFDDSDDSGHCEACSDCVGGDDTCASCELPEKGAVDCKARCE